MQDIRNDIMEQYRVQQAQVLGREPSQDVLDERVRCELKQPTPGDLVSMFGMVDGDLSQSINDESEFQFFSVFSVSHLGGGKLRVGLTDAP